MFDFLQDFPVGICFCKRNYTVRFWNSRLEIWTGISAQQIVDKDLRDFFPEIKSKRYTDRIKMVYEDKAPAIFSSMLHETLFKCCSLSSEHSIHNITVLPNYNKAEHAYDFSIIAEDVTALKKRSQDFQESKNFLSLIMNSAPDLISVKDREHKIVNANKAFLQFGLKERLNGTSDHHSAPQESEDFFDLDRLAFREGQSEAKETIPFSNGQIRTLHTKKIRFCDQKDQPYLLSISRDITDQIKEQKVMNEIYRIASTNLLEFREKIRVTLEVGRVYFGLDSGAINNIRNNKYEVAFTSCNTGLEEGHIFDLEGTYCWSVYNHHSVQAWHDTTKSNIALDPSYHKLGINAYIGTRVFVNEKVYGTLSFTSRTPRKIPFTEQEKSFLNLIAQYIGNEIAKEELLRSLQHANSELEEFAYRTSHDLRSPLVSSVSLLGMAKEALAKGQQETAIDSLNRIQKSLTKLETLVKDILALTYVKGVEEEETEIDLNLLIDVALEKFAHMSHFGRLQFKRDLTFQEPLCLKKSRITLIVENLISNAIKYQDLEEQSSYFKISSYRQDKNFVLEAEDNGLGIPEDDHGKLFQMFKRFHAKVAFGSGLGLYMMKKSAEILGGNLIFEEPKKGVIFRLMLPL